jgi:hypothetical protein
MRTFIFILALMASGTAIADELTAGDLYSFCNGNDELNKAACRFYILGVVQGISFGDGSIMNNTGRVVEKSKTLFCIPDDMPQSQMVAIYQKAVQALARAYPQDLTRVALRPIEMSNFG